MDALPIPPIPHEASDAVLHWVIGVMGTIILILSGAVARIWVQLQGCKEAISKTGQAHTESIAAINQGWSDKLLAREQQYWREARATDKWRAWAEGKMLLLSVLQEHRGDVIAIISADAETKLITQWNTGAAYLFGWDAGEIKGKPVTRLIPERYLEKHEESMQKCVAERNRIPRHGPFEVHGMTKGGDEVPVTIVYACYLEQRHTFMAIIKRRNEEPTDENSDAKGG